ncbi:MAG TPA: hypothetical protein PLH91_09030 [Tenuifilaceae bacterium]|nr:hypothetical protein [Tenuifilaceae bacterium]HPI45363.1 hypothetical protein [Tenuifilaceae bacterium]HPN20662.1 hypothetical protein [Tenuifilaceae bacterium]
MKSNLNLGRLIVITILCFAFACQKDSSVASRSFLMGFSPWHYDNTLEAQSWTYDKIITYGDIISEHMEEGVPWQESYDGSPFPQSFIDEIQSRIALKGIKQKVLLQISPLNVSRNGLANYRGTLPNQTLPEEWSNLAFNDDKVKVAFLNYAKRMVQYFAPDYLLVGVESNLLIRNKPEVWSQYVELQQHIYSELKKVYPNLPISVSMFCVPYFPQWSNEDNLEQQINGLRDIEPYVDFVSFSLHPFMSGLLAESFPDNYLSQLFGLTTKPIAVSESSYSAQVWQTASAPILTFNGSEEKQKNFLKLFLEQSNKSRVEFVIWFCVRDYDALWQNALGSSPDALPWRDTGLYDEQGNERLAMDLWKNWYGKIVER